MYVCIYRFIYRYRYIDSDINIDIVGNIEIICRRKKQNNYVDILKCKCRYQKKVTLLQHDSKDLHIHWNIFRSILIEAAVLVYLINVLHIMAFKVKIDQRDAVVSYFSEYGTE